jgi:hypothetical protein
MTTAFDTEDNSDQLQTALPNVEKAREARVVAEVKRRNKVKAIQKFTDAINRQPVSVVNRKGIIVGIVTGQMS